MRIHIERDATTLERDHEGTARALLASLGILPETVLIVKDGTLVTEDDDISDAESIELLSVISGG